MQQAPASKKPAHRKSDGQRASLTLLERLYEVRDQLNALPAPSRDTEWSRGNAPNLRAAFGRTDPVLAALRTQIAEARRHYARQVSEYGLDDAMVEALSFQLEALEHEMQARLSALRETETSGRAASHQNNKKDLWIQMQARLKQEEARLLELKTAIEQKKRKDDAFWAFVLLALGIGPATTQKTPFFAGLMPAALAARA